MNKSTAKRSDYEEEAQSSIRTNHLLIIGIDEYENGISPLNNAVKDAKAFKTALFDKFQFEEKNCTTLFNKEATRGNIIQTFGNLLDRLTTNDNLIFYYSGHGEQLTSGTGKRGYWIPSDAKLDKNWTYIPNEEILHLFKNSNAHHIFGIVDSCFSGSLFQKTKDLASASERIDSFPSRWLLTAGRLEVVSDGQLGSNSPFAKALLTYLDHQEEDQLWVSDLCNWVLKGMDFNTQKQTPRGEALQNAGHYGGQFVFYKKGVTPIKRPSNSLDQNQANTPTRRLSEDKLITPKQESPTTLEDLQQLLKLELTKDLGKAIATFKSYLNTNSSIDTDLILLSSRFNSNKKDMDRGLITGSTAKIELNRIRYALINYIENLEKEDIKLPS